MEITELVKLPDPFVAKNEDVETSDSAIRVMRFYEQSKGMPN